MTVTVTVKARAHGAKLNVDGQELNVEANREQTFQVNADSPLTLTVNEPATVETDDVPVPVDPPADEVKTEAVEQVEAEKPERISGFGKRPPA